MKDQYKVLVMLSAYNGEKYIEEQIYSIFNQQSVDVTILVRDDGSKDATLEVLDLLKKKYGKIDIIKGVNKGFTGSFTELVTVAYSNYGSFQYYSFADQDDVWFDNKLITACNTLCKYPSDKPCLFSCNSMITDSKLQPIELFWKKQPEITRGNIIEYGLSQGCSMTFNYEALKLYAENPPQLNWHDRWMTLICNYLGHYEYCQEPLFYYRYHGGNALMIDGNTEPDNLIKHIYSRLYYYFVFGPISHHYEMANEFISVFGEFLDDEDLELFKIYTTYRKNVLNRFKIMFGKVFRPLDSWDKKKISKHRKDALFSKV